MSNKSYNVKGKISDALELPKEIILDIPKITLLGTESISIENHKGIIKYSEKEISINTESGVLIVIGDKLVIKSIVEEEIIIIGWLKGISF